MMVNSAGIDLVEGGSASASSSVDVDVDSSIVQWSNVCSYAGMFVMIYVAAVWVLRRWKGLGCAATPLDPHLAASRVIGSVHSGVLLPVIMPLLLAYAPTFPYTAPNTPLQVRIIEWSYAYFAVDMLHMILYEPSDVFLVVHHLVCIAYFGSVLHAGRSGVAMLCAVVAGEITNPLQNVWFLSKLSGCTRVYQLISPVFTACFVLVRCVVLPFWVYDIIVNGWVRAWYAGELDLPYVVAWSAMCLLMTLGSFMWSFKMVVGLIKLQRKRKDQKMQ